jgi:hypothetical protein
MNAERLHWQRHAERSQAASAAAARAAAAASEAAQAALHSLHTPYKYYRLTPTRFRSIMEVRQAKMRHITKTVSYCPFSGLAFFVGERTVVELEGLDARNVERGHPVIPKVVNPYDSDDDFHDPECVVEAAWQCMKEPEHLLLEFGEPTRFTGYRIQTAAAESSTGRDPIDWVLEGSHDRVQWATVDNHLVPHKSEWEVLREMNGSELSHEEKERRRELHKALHELSQQEFGADFVLQRHERQHKVTRQAVDSQHQEYIFTPSDSHLHDATLPETRVKFSDKPDECPHARLQWCHARRTNDAVEVLAQAAEAAAELEREAAEKRRLRAEALEEATRFRDEAELQKAVAKNTEGRRQRTRSRRESFMLIEPMVRQHDAAVAKPK